MNERDRTFPPAVLRFSELKEIRKSPAHFRAAYETVRDEDVSLRIGQLTHTLILGGDAFAVYEGERRGNAWKDFQAKHPNTFIVTEKEFARANRVALAARKDPVARPLLEGLKEQELTWEAFGRKCAGRVDIIGSNFIADVKTTRYAEPGFFSREALRRAYHAQLAWYSQGAQANGHAVNNMYLLGVETGAPYAVTVLRVTMRAEEEGRKLLRLWVERVATSEASNEWPGYVQAPVDLDIMEEAGLIFDDIEAA
jgi:exodeoxyribonuclease VIII